MNFYVVEPTIMKLPQGKSAGLSVFYCLNPYQYTWVIANKVWFFNIGAYLYRTGTAGTANHRTIFYMKCREFSSVFQQPVVSAACISRLVGMFFTQMCVKTTILQVKAI